MNSPRTSVIIPVFNRSTFLRRALESVIPQVDDTTEIIIIDDGSTENIGAIVSAFTTPGLRLVRRAHNGGAAAARNTGIAEARGTYIAFLDSDDEWLPGKLDRQTAYLDFHPSVACCCTAYELHRLIRPPEVRYFNAERQGLADIAFGCALSPGTTLCARRELFAVVGGFEESLPRLEDWDWLLRAVDYSEIGVLNEPLSIIHNIHCATEEAVEISTAYMRQHHHARFARLGVIHLMRFTAGLYYERAVAAFCAGHTWRASWFYLRSLLAYPIRPIGHFLYIFSILLKPRWRAALRCQRSENRVGDVRPKAVGEE